MKVPFLNLAGPDKEVLAAMSRVMERGELILGPEVRAFEEEWALYCRRDYAVGVGSGLDALRLILQAYCIGPEDEVLVPANTCIATWMAISAVGATPVGVDVGADMNMDPAKAETSVTRATRALIVVHLYGRVADMPPLRDVADRHGLHLIADAAQAHGVKGNDLGDAAGFSFYPTKNLGALGDGGAVVTDNEALANEVRALRNYGAARKDEHNFVGINSRLDELQAAALRVKLRRLDEINAHRLANAELYSNLLAPLTNILEPELGCSVWHLYVICSRERDNLRVELDRRGVGTMIHYPTPPHRQKCYSGPQYRQRDFPVAEQFAREIVSLPITASLEATRYVAEMVAECASSL